MISVQEPSHDKMDDINRPSTSGEKDISYLPDPCVNESLPDPRFTESNDELSPTKDDAYYSDMGTDTPLENCEVIFMGSLGHNELFTTIQEGIAAVIDVETESPKLNERTSETSSVESDGPKRRRKKPAKKCSPESSMEDYISGSSSDDIRTLESDEKNEYLHSNAEGWRRLLNSISRIPLVWSEDSEPIFWHMLGIEGNKIVLEKDMFRLVGFYVTFGLRVFQTSCLQNPSSDEKKEFKELVNKYGFIDGGPKEPKCFNMRGLAEKSPFYVAEHLHRRRGAIFGKLFALPRCYAFTGGYQLIMPGVEYENLRELWKMYEATFMASYAKKKKRTDFMFIDYCDADPNVKQMLVDRYEIKVPSNEEILHSIGMEMLKIKIERDDRCYTLSDFEKLCQWNAEDLFSFYENLKLKIPDE